MCFKIQNSSAPLLQARLELASRSLLLVGDAALVVVIFMHLAAPSAIRGALVASLLLHIHTERRIKQVLVHIEIETQYIIRFRSPSI